jgi:hypothetical protein
MAPIAANNGGREAGFGVKTGVSARGASVRFSPLTQSRLGIALRADGAADCSQTLKKFTG